MVFVGSIDPCAKVSVSQVSVLCNSVYQTVDPGLILMSATDIRVNINSFKFMGVYGTAYGPGTTKDPTVNG